MGSWDSLLALLIGRRGRRASPSPPAPGSEAKAPSYGVQTTSALPQTRFARSGDVSIAYQIWGNGPIDIVFVPGVVSNIEMFHEFPGNTDFFRRLSRFARVATFDKRGQGLSDRITGAPTLEQRADDVRAVMDAAGMSRVALIAHSEGATMGAFFAAAHPDRVSHLILYGGFPKQLKSDDYPWGATREQIDVFAGLWGTGTIMKLGAPAMFEDAAMFAVGARVERQSCSPGNFKALMELNAQLDARSALSQIGCPTLVLHNRHDPMVPLACGQYYADHIPGAKLIEYDAHAHFYFAGDYAAACSDIEEFITGARSNDVAPDRILATVLFTDIVGSTSKAAELGDELWSVTLDQHDQILRKLVAQHRGRLIKSTGDGALASFDGPGRAIRCGLDIGAALAPLNINVRVGLHAGEVVKRGADIGGVAVHAAARVMSMAGPGEVLVSRVVADLVAGSGFVLVDRGEVELKGLAGPWRLFAVAA